MRSTEHFVIHLLGPGGAGKTTTGAALADRLGMPFVDLDAEFAARHGDISACLDEHGYDGYARRNVDLYSGLAATMDVGVVALSSGFMTYQDDVHADYLRCRQRIASSQWTVALLASLDLETCVGAVVRRQLRRPFARTPEREEQVIRERFPVYLSLPVRKVTTLRPVGDVVDELLEMFDLCQTSPSPHRP